MESFYLRLVLNTGYYPGDYKKWTPILGLIKYKVVRHPKSDIVTLNDIYFGNNYRGIQCLNLKEFLEIEIKK